jgi:hypothetical protein
MGRITLVFVQRGEEIQGVWRVEGGSRGSLEGKAEAGGGSFALRPLSEKCPGSGEGTIRIDGTKLSGEYRGQDCRGKIDDGKFEVQR